MREGKESAGAFNYYTAQAMCLQCHFQKPTTRREREHPRCFTILAHESGTHLYFEFPTPTHVYDLVTGVNERGHKETSKNQHCEKQTLTKHNLHSEHQRIRELDGKEREGMMRGRSICTLIYCLNFAAFATFGNQRLIIIHNPTNIRKFVMSKTCLKRYINLVKNMKKSALKIYAST